MTDIPRLHLSNVVRLTSGVTFDVVPESLTNQKIKRLESLLRAAASSWCADEHVELSHPDILAATRMESP